MHRHARAAEYWVAALDVNQSTGPVQGPQRCSELAPRLAQVDLEQPALYQDDVARGFRQSVEYLASQLGCDAIAKPPFERQHHERPDVKQPGRTAGIFADDGGDRLGIDSARGMAV